MTEKGKKTDPKAGHARHVPAEEHAGAGAEPSAHSRKISEHGPKLLPYRKDPHYHALLAHFQRAEWAECLKSIDHLLKAHPGDEHLLAFKHDVQLRSEHQEHSDKQRVSDEQRHRRKVQRRAVIAALSGVIVLILLVWFISSYQAEETRKRLSAEATQTAEALAVQDETADILMKAGKAEQALALYEQIQSVDPSYDGVEDAIRAAQLAMRVEDLYQQGTRAMEDGDNDKALKLLGEVEELAPEYKDTSQLIAGITQDMKIDSLLDSIDRAYGRGDSAAVIEYYEEIQATDPYLELSELDDELFVSYQDLILQIAARPDPSLEEIQAAARYYRSALALFPQSLAYSREREELQEVAIELLASQYYLQGISLLESSDYSVEGLQQSILVLQRAREKAPDSPVVDSAIEKSQLFIDSYDSIVHGDWDRAIAGFDTLYRRDANFAEGRVRYFLYEAYTSRGDLLVRNGDFGGAFRDYQAAEKFAFEDEGNLMRLFQIEVRIADALRRLGSYEQALEFYRFAFEQVAYKERLKLPEQSSLLETLEQAEAALAEGSEQAAIGHYEDAVEKSDVLYELVRITGRRGDTLPNISFENGSTLASLRSANDLGDSLILSRTQPISVPVLAPVQK